MIRILFLHYSRIYILISVLFLSGCTNSYHEHFFREHPEFDTPITVSSEAFRSDGRIESLPNGHSYDNLVQTIDGAKKRIWIEIYTWTDAAKLSDSIIRAQKRGVDIRVVLEGNVFGTPKINIPIVKKLKDAGIIVAYADNHRYTFTHAKFWIIDNEYSISTGNWTASFFTKNREYIYHNNDTTTLNFLEQIFIADSTHMGYKSPSSIPSHIVLSPIDSRAKIERLILSTEKNLIFYVQTLDDDHMISIITELYASKKHIKICTADNESNRARKLEFPNWSWKLVRKPYLHAKVIIVDHSRLFIGSHNLTTNAIENNREVGVILDHPDIKIIHQIENNFMVDGCD